MTDWAGPLSTVRRIRLGLRRSICAGEDMIINGRVSRKFERDGEHRVDIDIDVSTQNGPAYDCGGTLALPTRDSYGHAPSYRTAAVAQRMRHANERSM